MVVEPEGGGSDFPDHYKGDTLTPDGNSDDNPTLVDGDYLLSHNGLYKLEFEQSGKGNGKLVEYDSSGALLWEKDVSGNEVQVDYTNGLVGVDDQDSHAISLDHTNNWGEGKIKDFILQDDGTFVGYDTDKKSDTHENIVRNASTKTDRYSADQNRDFKVVTPTGASQPLKDRINQVNDAQMPTLAGLLGTGVAPDDRFIVGPGGQKTEREMGTGPMTFVPNWPADKITHMPRDVSEALARESSDSGVASDAYNNTMKDVNNEEDQWTRNDTEFHADLTNMAQRQADAVRNIQNGVHFLNEKMQAVANISGPISPDVESTLYPQITNMFNDALAVAQDYATYCTTLFPAPAAPPPVKPQPADPNAGKPKPADPNAGKPKPADPNAGKPKPADHNTGNDNTGGDNSGSHSTGNDNTGAGKKTGQSSGDVTTTDYYKSLFPNGPAADGADPTGQGDPTNQGGDPTPANPVTPGAPGPDEGAVMTAVDQLASGLANGGGVSAANPANSDNGMSALMQNLIPAMISSKLGQSFGPGGNSQNSGPTANQSPVQYAQPATYTRPPTAASSAPATAAPAATTPGASAAATPAAAGNGNRLVSASLDGENQQLPSVIADVVNKELNNPDGSNAVEAYSGTLGESSTAQPWQELDPKDPNSWHTGDVMEWHDRSALVVHDDKGLHLIIDGKLHALTIKDGIVQEEQDPPHDDFGAYGEFKGVFRPTGAALNAMPSTPPVDTAGANPPVVTSTQTPPKTTPPLST